MIDERGMGDMHRVRKRQPKQPSGRACVRCQKRKSKCVGSNGPGEACSRCAEVGKPCVFEDPPIRTPLTRKNLDAAERRCDRLVNLIRSFKPELDVEAALQEISNFSPLSNSIEPAQGRENRSQSPSDEYEWQEADSPGDDGDGEEYEEGDRDGMASLYTRTYESGYLGDSSGSTLLKTIAALLPLGSNETTKRSRQRPESSKRNPRDADTSTNFGLLDNLANSALLDHLVDAYFLFYNSYYPILHEHTFRNAFRDRARIGAKSSWHIIFYMALSIGHWASNPDTDDGKCVYYSAARSHLSIHSLESGNLETVQAFLLLGNYLQKRNRPNTGYNFIGIAHRMALGLGLHREVPQVPADETVTRERRRRVFWTLYCFESGFSITTGRPTTMSDAFIDIRMPLNIEDKDCLLSSKVPDEVDYPTTYSSIIAHARLAIIANKIHNIFLPGRTSNREIEPQRKFDEEQELIQWKASLPAYFFAEEVPQWFRGPRAVLFWKEQNLRIMLYRASQRYPGVWPGSFEARWKCQLVAVEAIHEITSFCKNFTNITNTSLSWYAIYFLFQAILVFNVQRLEEQVSNSGSLSDKEDAVWNIAISEARECFTRLKGSNKAAQRCLTVLDRLHTRFVAPLEERNATQFSLAQGFAAPLTDQGLLVHRDLTNPQYDWPDTVDDIINRGASTADSSLHMLFGDLPMEDLFNDMQGFPGIADQEHFNYITSGFHD